MPYKLFSGAAARGDEADDPKARQTHDDMRRTNWFFTLFVGVGLAFVIAHKFGAPAVSITTALLWVLACSVSGAAVGFLFGIPKIFQGNRPVVEQAGGATAPAAAEAADYRQQVNTNLTEISDWLTKIIVGLGLINLKEIPDHVGGMASALAAGLNPADPAAERGFAFGIITSFSVFGFLFGYIYTRVFIAVIFSRADREATATQIDEVRRLAQRALTGAENAQTTALGVGKQQPAEAATRSELPAAPMTDDDPWKDKFGGSNRHNGRELTAEVEDVAGSPDLFSVCLKVRSTDEAKTPLRGTVQFFLHPTFNNPEPVVKVGPEGVAELWLTAWGAFTVGAKADEGKTRLELDLSQLEEAPGKFRSR